MVTVAPRHRRTALPSTPAPPPPAPCPGPLILPEMLPLLPQSPGHSAREAPPAKLHRPYPVTSSLSLVLAPCGMWPHRPRSTPREPTVCP